jgi:hypothetical protein
MLAVFSGIANFLKFLAVAACFITLAAPADQAAFHRSGKGMARRCVQGMMDVLEKNYGGDITQMPYVVSKGSGLMAKEI